MDALGDPTRRAIVEQLRRRPLPVGELAAGLPVSRPAVSQHLRVLREAGLVSERRDGTRRIYRLDPRGLEELRAWVERFWADALASFGAAAEREEEA
jgi:DNA-binding transcriptional ArsR family regulator